MRQQSAANASQRSFPMPQTNKISPPCAPYTTAPDSIALPTAFASIAFPSTSSDIPIVGGSSTAFESNAFS